MPSFYEFKDHACLVKEVQTSQPTVVLFVHNGISIDEITKLFQGMEHLSAQFAEQVRFFWIGTEPGSEICKGFEIDHLPEVVLFHEGNVELKLIDPTSEDCLKYNLEKALAHEKFDWLRPVQITA